MQCASVTTMTEYFFGGDPQQMSKLFEVMVNHMYFTFYNEVLGTSVVQWLPSHVNTFH